MNLIIQTIINLIFINLVMVKNETNLDDHKYPFHLSIVYTGVRYIVVIW